MKNILITGGSSLIGRNLITFLLKKKCKIICHVNKNKIFIKGNKIKYIRSNFLILKSLQNFIKILCKQKSNIDCIIHLPSLKISFKRLEDYNWNEINNQLNIQVRSIHLIIKNLIKKKKISENASIIILGSKSTEFNKSRGMLDYMMAKGLLKYYTYLLKLELKNKKIYLINPDMFESPLLSNLPSFFVKKNSRKSNYKNKIVNKILSLVYKNTKN